jgi:hypothetical protein
MAVGLWAMTAAASDRAIVRYFMSFSLYQAQNERGRYSARHRSMFDPRVKTDYSL